MIKRAFASRSRRRHSPSDLAGFRQFRHADGNNGAQSGEPCHALARRRRRQEANGPQQLISVDLRKALLDAAERIIIQPNDISLLQYQKGEAALT
jgi:hypothetical protein